MPSKSSPGHFSSPLPPPPLPPAPSAAGSVEAPHNRGDAAQQTAESYSAPVVPVPYTPPRCVVPHFPPIRPGGRGGRRLLRRAVRRRRGPLAVGMAVAAAVLTVSATHSAPPPRAPMADPRPAAAAAPRPTSEALVRAPVRIADAGVAALLRAGDRVDVLAGGRVLAAGVPVVAVPGDPGTSPVGNTLRDPAAASGGALIVLKVPRRTAAALSGASATTPLGVALC